MAPKPTEDGPRGLLGLQLIDSIFDIEERELAQVFEIEALVRARDRCSSSEAAVKPTSSPRWFQPSHCSGEHLRSIL